MKMNEPDRYDDRDKKSGRFRREFPDSDFLDALRGRGGAATSQVAEDVGCKYRTAYARLNDLEDEGRVSSRQIGNSLLWGPPADEFDKATGGLSNGAEDRVDRDDGLQDASGHTVTRDAEQRAEADAGIAGPDTADDVGQDAAGAERDELEDVEFPGSRDRVECVTAVLAAYDYLGEHGPATMWDLVGDVMPAYPVGYDVPELKEGQRYRGAWWRKVVKPGLEALPNASKPPSGTSEWSYTGDDAPENGGIYDPADEF